MTGDTDNTDDDEVAFWMAPSSSRPSKNRVLHGDRGCKSLARSNPRAATDREIDLLEECDHCIGPPPTPSQPDLSYQEALKNAAEANEEINSND